MILHVCTLDKFIPPFIELINGELDPNEHFFLLYGDKKNFPFKEFSNVEHQPYFAALREDWFIGLKNICRFIQLARKSSKIILHGLFDDNFVKLLVFLPSLPKKCYWVMWGADLYRFKFRKKTIRDNLSELFRRIVIGRIGHLVTYIYGDYELAQQHYNARGKYHECLIYPSNLYKDLPVKNVRQNSMDTINIQVGNSADPRNNHLEVLEKLQAFKDQDIKIFVPLSYGDQEHANHVIANGKQMFGDKFIAMTELMSLDKYVEFLSEIDIAIFNHERQQGMGNIITLLGLGKKMFIRDDITSWDALKNLSLNIYDTNDLSSLLALDETALVKNRQVVKNFFSQGELLKQWKIIFAV